MGKRDLLQGTIVIDVSLELEMGLNNLVVNLRGGVLHVDAVPILPLCFLIRVIKKDTLA
jgi:hypothetical protein